MKNAQNARIIVLAGLLLVAMLWFTAYGESYSIGPNYRNVSIDTTVNITNAKPEVLFIDINNAENITLNAGSTYRVLCNATVRDFNGGATIANVTSAFYDNTSASFGDAADGNNYYVNDSCTQTGVNGFFANYSCGFDVQYFANATNEWICNVTANDVFDFNGTDYGDNFNVTAINTLLALNVTPLIDYGDLAVEDTSAPQEANVTNFGNVPINVSVYGYGNVTGDGLAMVCDVGDIGIANQKYSLNALDDFDTQYVSLASTANQIAGLTIPQQFDDFTPVVNSTYWRLYVEPNPFGVCNGTVVFQAESST
jgi:hypothetical protein